MQQASPGIGLYIDDDAGRKYALWNRDDEFEETNTLFHSGPRIKELEDYVTVDSDNLGEKRRGMRKSFESESSN
jgi:hypothetical protein